MKKITAVLFIFLVSLATFSFADSVNINTADVETLSTLKGDGPSKAQAIVDHRDKNGPYRSRESLADVKGIGEKTVEMNLDSISTE